mmetsp:Transcript_2407/g.7171  ORF Transcript_2407/g.7171 Transcript_2407/m.7171 type:complete len:269 (-) Transcript_2407:57-863(-)
MPVALINSGSSYGGFSRPRLPAKYARRADQCAGTGTALRYDFRYTTTSGSAAVTSQVSTVSGRRLRALSSASSSRCFSLRSRRDSFESAASNAPSPSSESESSVSAALPSAAAAAASTSWSTSTPATPSSPPASSPLPPPPKDRMAAWSSSIALRCASSVASSSATSGITVTYSTSSAAEAAPLTTDGARVIPPPGATGESGAFPTSPPAACAPCAPCSRAAFLAAFLAARRALSLSFFDFFRLSTLLPCSDASADWRAAGGGPRGAA